MLQQFPGNIKWLDYKIVNISQMRGVFRFLFLASVLFLLSSKCPENKETGKPLRICVIDVDQGDAILIISPQNRYLLIDGGDRGYGDSEINPLLDSLGIKHLDYTVVSHYHADHIGGLDEVISHYDTLYIVERDTFKVE